MANVLPGRFASSRWSCARQRGGPIKPAAWQSRPLTTTHFLKGQAMVPDDLSPNARLALRALACASERNLEGFRTCCAPDIVLDFPFHPNGAQTHYGVDEMIREFSVEKVFETFRIDPQEVLDCGDKIIIEGRSHGTYRSGRPPYGNHYIFIMACKDGKVTHWKEFYNPLEALKQNYGKPRPEKQAGA
ncbi:nuclear transport factor 2 family protein [Cupriavidus necator]|nr:nuclear transport factor 2 family protein [Cupriavidus necator]MDX6008165.1 nuclear transport factor 2 family protein [Cupriavidus necator]